MPVDYLPSREAELVAWVGRFNALINAGAESYGLTTLQAGHYGTLAADFISSYQLARADATRSPSNIVRKNRDKAILIANTRQLAGIIQRFPGTTDAMRVELGMTVRRGPTMIARPADAPALSILRREGTGVLIRLRDATSERRGRPPGVQGARVYSFVGGGDDAPPAGLDGWRLEGQVTRTTKVDLTFPAGTIPGTKVWLTACWYNPRGETGPACDPVSTYIAGGAMPMRQAA